ncbi:protein SMAX1-LIKE 4 [Sesamum indicum]|uniref:Protein SMAX1-LIKE 4 n=1 Tax=Sesamum indicum TaxID=4182 RepID=A0A6I9U966_SESIN|nr:protein SMAX1-LIKE 4 [Sesamum indicum]
MRAGACPSQQTLSAEAASVLKHSLSLARRRGHAQVTPLHVAATLLSSRTSLLRRACLKSQPHQPSHPLQCRALELCFNVALNRLPATPGPLLHAQPSLSNALVAALKRAQAHQRRGSIEQQQQQQQQPLIAIKVELEQLILSILDDPSVSRVMREAGFSSTAVKNNLEDSTNSVSSVFQCYNYTSGGIYSTPSSPPTETQREVLNPSSGFWHSHLLSYASEQNPFLFSPQKKPVSNPISDAYSSLKEDIKVVLEVLLRKKRKNTVIVGDSLSMAEGLVEEVMRKVERGDVPEELKSAHWIKFQFSSVPLRFMKTEEVEMNIADLKRKVDSFASGGRGVIIYTGDLKWAVDSGNDEKEEGLSTGKEGCFYSPVDHFIAEMGKLLSWYNSSNSRVWLMATANYQTYMKSQMKQPPLDVQWTLQAVSVPSGGLGLSLNATSVQESRINFSQNQSQVLDNKPFSVKEEQDVLTCCPECTSNYEKEAGLKSIQQKSFLLNSTNKDSENGSAQLPFWLKPHGVEAQVKDDLVQLRRKYNKLCQSLHQGSHNPNNSSSVISNQCHIGRNYNYTSSFPYWPNKSSIFADAETISFANHTAVKSNQTPSSLPKFRRQQSCHIEFSFSNGSSKYQSVGPNLDSLKSIDDKEVKITLALGNSAYSDELISERSALDADLCGIFQENVPWQSETIPLIVDALMDSNVTNQDKFILIQGNDLVAKRRLAVGIAKSMFGSSELLFCMNMRKNKSTVCQNRDMLEKALRNHEKLVILVEDVDFADPELAKFLADGYETGKLGTLRDTSHTIFILTMNGDPSYNKAKENKDSVIQMKLVISESRLDSGTANPDHKRKADWGLSIRSKNQRNNNEMEEVSSDAADNRKQLQFTRQSSSNALDLNIRADEDEGKEGKQGEFSPISSDLTRETTTEQQNSLRFLEKIKNCFVLNRNSDQEEHAREMFLSKFKRSFEEVSGNRNISSFNVEELVLEEILQGSGLHLNSLFEQWLKEVFQTSLRMVDTGEREKVSIRLCSREKGESSPEAGFLGTCLPTRIQVSLTG